LEAALSTLSAYRGLLAVLDAGSVSAAARALDVPRPTLSRWLAELEEHLGVRLLHRSSGGVLPTRAGEVLADQLRPWLRALTDAEDSVRRMDDVPRGLLRVSAPPPVVAQLAPLLARFLEEHPEVEVELLATQRGVDLRAEQFDVVLRAGSLRDPSLVARRLLAFDVLAVAAPGFLERHGGVEHVEQLAGLPCLRGYDQDERPQSLWPLRGGGTIAVKGPLATNDRRLLREGALGGLGVALLARFSIEDDLRSGRLVPVLEEVVGTNAGLYVVYADRTYLPARVRAFVDSLLGGVDAHSFGSSPGAP
jgi:DNA-binding transcriptional LysR family regulator